MALSIAAPRWHSAARFLALGAFWNALLFGLMRTPAFVEYAALPLTRLQAALSAWYGAAPAAPIRVTLDCNGTDLMAICGAFILAYPVSRRWRLIGVAAVVPVLFVLNAIRIATLAMAAGSPVLFDRLHLMVWPAALALAGAGLVLAWMRLADRGDTRLGGAAAALVLSLSAFAVAVPWLYTSTFLDAACRTVAASAAAVMWGAGAHVSVAGPVLSTPRGLFVVTPECLLSPIIPLWVAGALWWPMRRRYRMLAVALTLPVAWMLAVGRLMVLAVPGAWIDVPLVFVHGFHQLVFFAAAVMVAALSGAPWAGPRARTVARGAIAVAASAVAAVVAGPAYNALLTGVAGLLKPVVPAVLTTLRPAGDVQGALLMLPMYQVVLLLALVWSFGQPVRWRRLGLALAATFVVQVGLLAGIGELAARSGVSVHALVLRGIAAAWPIALALLIVRRPVGIHADRAAYQAFWMEVGEQFPDLGGAASTALYFENEKRLFNRFVPDLSGRRVFKSDLWDEARNTRILQWVQGQGARVFGIDISRPVIAMAGGQFHRAPLSAANGDVRAVPFADGSFDVVYSMGTIEHFNETEQAVGELFRILKPGGRAIIGVPNRHDPFLRPLMVALLYRLGLYDYGFEKSYSRKQLKAMLAAAGFRVVGDDGILFIPGWLRMLDLLFHTRWPFLAGLTGVAVKAFVWLDAHVPALRRHGYLVVAVGERPIAGQSSGAFSANGHEWIVDAVGCQPDRLRSRAALEAVFADVVGSLRMAPVGEATWHHFDGEAGITGLQMLSESHLACHTYPEAAYAAFSLYCCRPGVGDWPWRERLIAALGATDVMVRVLPRGPAVIDASRTPTDRERPDRS